MECGVNANYPTRSGAVPVYRGCMIARVSAWRQTKHCPMKSEPLVIWNVIRIGSETLSLNLLMIFSAFERQGLRRLKASIVSAHRSPLVGKSVSVLQHFPADFTQVLPVEITTRVQELRLDSSLSSQTCRKYINLSGTIVFNPYTRLGRIPAEGYAVGNIASKS